MPEAALAVDEQVERRIDQMRHVGWRHACIGRRDERLASTQRAPKRAQESGVVPRAKERAGADDQCIRQQSEHASLRLRLALAVEIDRLGLVFFGDGRPPWPSKTKADENVTNGMPRRRHAAANVTAAHVCLPAGIALRLGIVPG